MRRSGLRAALAAAIVFFASSTASAVTMLYSITFSDAAVLPGIVKLDVVGLTATLVDFRIDEINFGSSFGIEDTVGGFSPVFSGSDVVGIALTSEDDAAPGNTGGALTLTGGPNTFTVEAFDSSFGGTYTLTAVPEPGAALLVAAGLGALAVRRRR